MKEWFPNLFHQAACHTRPW